MAVLTKKDVKLIVDESISEAKLATKDELAQAVSKLATKDELAHGLAQVKSELRAEIRELRNDLSDQINQGRILLEETNSTVKAMYEWLQPKMEKIAEINPLNDRVDSCETQIDVISVAVKNHVTDQKLHRSPRRVTQAQKDS